MPKPRPKITRTRPTKEVSVMAWIEDAEQKVLLVRQAVGLRLWALPGGKVKRGESLVKALRRDAWTARIARIKELRRSIAPVASTTPRYASLTKPSPASRLGSTTLPLPPCY